MCICGIEQCRLYILFTLVLHYCNMSNLSENIKERLKTSHVYELSGQPSYVTGSSVLFWDRGLLSSDPSIELYDISHEI